MQDCLSNGKPLLIENIEEELDPLLDPVLEKRYIKQAQGNVLQLGDKEVRLSAHDGDTPISCREQLRQNHIHDVQQLPLKITALKMIIS